MIDPLTDALFRRSKVLREEPEARRPLTLSDHAIGLLCTVVVVVAVLCVLSVLALPAAVLYQVLRW